MLNRLHEYNVNTSVIFLFGFLIIYNLIIAPYFSDMKTADNNNILFEI